MQVAPTISFRGMKTSPALEEKIAERITRLEQFHPRITACRVTVDAPHRSHTKGTLYKVSVDLIVPGHEIAVSRNSHDNHAHEDAYVAVRDAFDEAERQLEDIARKSSSHRTRQPGLAVQGHVDRLFPDNGFGFLTTLDNQEVYFSFDRLPQKCARELRTGSKVRFVIGESDTGPYAHSISLLDPVGVENSGD